jgi:hypothetical protein
MKRIFFSLLLGFSFLCANAQLPDTCKLEIGTNLAGPADWGSEWPLVDIMKYSRTWITCNNQWVGGGTNDWDTQVLSQIPLDEDGWPLELPVEVPGTEAPQIVRTVWANTGKLSEGTYVVLYDGVGTFEFWGSNATVVNQEPGRIEVAMIPEENGILAMELKTSQAGDHLRNIRVLMPGTEATYPDQIWTESYLEKLEPFNSLRFMDWGHTNNSVLTEWSDRPRVDDYTYTPDGLPYEYWVELCNMKQADAWVCIPHLANEEYVREMARFFRDELDPNLTIYVEYSNEIWNWLFAQAHYCHDNGDQNVPWPERIVPFIQQALDWWSDEFEGELDRIVRVVGVQHSWQDVSNRIVMNMEPGSFDAFAPAAYFGLNDDAIAALEALGADATGDDVIFWARQTMLNEAYSWTASQFESLAQELDIPMLYYEGGQHLTPNPFGTVQPYGPALVEAQTHPEMYDLYNEWLDTLRTFVPADDPGLFMNFSFIGPTSEQYGSWGALEDQFYQEAPYLDIAPKYQALLDNIYNCSSPSSTLSADAYSPDINIAPNPAASFWEIRTEQPLQADVRVIDVAGRIIDQHTLQGTLLTIPCEQLPAGSYWLRIVEAKGKWVEYRQVVKQ